MLVDHDRTGGLECRVAQKPAAGLLQHFGSHGADALRHGGEAEIGAVGNQRGQQRPNAARPVDTDLHPGVRIRLRTQLAIDNISARENRRAFRRPR